MTFCPNCKCKKCAAQKKKFYHVTSKSNLESIMSKGLKKNDNGVLYLTRDPNKWLGLHNDSVVLEVNMPNSTKYVEYECNDFICKNNITKKNIKTVKETGIFAKNIEKYLKALNIY